MTKIIRLMGIFITVALINGCSGDEEIPTTQLDNLIIDNAGIVNFSLDIMEQYREYNNYLLERFDIDFRVMTTDSEQDINSFTNEAYDTFQQESRSTSGRALLLVINTNLDETRVGVSMALEPIYTDAFVSYIERKGMVPYFRDSRVSGWGVYDDGACQGSGIGGRPGKRIYESHGNKNSGRRSEKHCADWSDRPWSQAGRKHLSRGGRYPESYTLQTLASFKVT